MKEIANIPDVWRNISDTDELNVTQRKVAETPMLPDHIKDLFERSCKSISSKETKGELAEMLRRNDKPFASLKSDVRSCSIFKHRIETAGAAPVRQLLRKPPLGFEGEEFKKSA